MYCLKSTIISGLSETGVIAYQRNSKKIGSSGYVSKNVKVMFVDLKTRKQVGSNIHAEIWCQTPCSVTSITDDIKMIESADDVKRVNEGPSQFLFNRFYDKIYIILETIVV